MRRSNIFSFLFRFSGRDELIRRIVLHHLKYAFARNRKKKCEQIFLFKKQRGGNCIGTAFQLELHSNKIYSFTVTLELNVCVGGDSDSKVFQLQKN